MLACLLLSNFPKSSLIAYLETKQKCEKEKIQIEPIEITNKEMKSSIIIELIIFIAISMLELRFTSALSLRLTII